MVKEKQQIHHMRGRGTFMSARESYVPLEEGGFLHATWEEGDFLRPH